MSTAPESQHLNDRPHWRCRACDRPWPCPDARTSLLDEYRAYPSLLKIYLAAQMYDALDDLTADGDSPPLDLYERFLSWTRARPAPPGSPPTQPSPQRPRVEQPGVEQLGVEQLGIEQLGIEQPGVQQVRPGPILLPPPFLGPRRKQPRLGPPLP